MKLDIEKIYMKSMSPTFYNILHDEEFLRFWTCKLCIPFGLENEYGKIIIKLELDEKNSEHVYLKKVVEHIEKLIRKKMDIDEAEFKSVIKKRPNKNDLLEIRLKTIKENIITKVEYEDKETHYLKTIYDLPKQSFAKVQLEINGLWDRRTDKKEENKCGLVIYATKMNIL